MANGFSNEDMIKLILEGQGKIQTQIDGLITKVDLVISHGCAHRPDDLRRIKELEDWRTKGIIGVISLFLAMVVSFFTGQHR
jgi:hypothetical protein